MAFVQWLLDLFTRIPAATTTALKLTSKLRRDHGDDVAPGTADQRYHAYQRFSDATLRASLNLQVLATVGTPPRWSGAVWTFPTAMRASRGFVESSYAAISALHDINIVGARDVLESALTVTAALGACQPSIGPRAVGAGSRRTGSPRTAPR